MSNPTDYSVGWICAISTELVAARAFLDEEHDPPNAVSPRDNNIYTLGKMGMHNVVIAALPDGEYGIAAAASVARDMLHSFPNVRIGLMVGIGGGVPGKHDIRLGDVVVSTTQHEHGGVFQYDFGKTIQAQVFQNTMFLDQPPSVLRSAVGDLKARYESDGHQFQEAMKSILAKKPKLRKKYQRPDPRTDRLYLNNAIHPLTSNEGCEIACSDSMLVPRVQRAEDEDDPTIHYGLIASGNQLMKDALIRDQLASKRDVLCFEMEAAGLMNHFPCLVIRGICDYSDSHKNEIWQGYAAMTAAAYASDLIRRIPPTRIEAENRIADILSGMKESVDRLVHVYHDQRNIAILDWLTPITYTTQQSDYLRRRQQGTGEWLLNSDQFQTWVKNENQMLFCPGMPGAGKTVLTSVVVDHLHSRFKDDSNTGITYFFFNYKRQEEQTTDALLASVLRQLIASQSSLPDVVHKLYKQHNTPARQTRPSTEELIRVLKSLTVIYSRTFIVIDALDECKVSNDTRLRVLSCIFQLRSDTGANFFITSRFNTEISSAFSNITTLEIRANDEDVRRYLSGNIVYLPRFVRNDPSLQENIIDSILQAVQGMFLVAQFHLESLKGKTTHNEVTIALQNLATGSDAYEQIYTETMKRIVGQYEEQTQLARSVLSWLTFAKRPMRVVELQHALGVRPKESCFDERNMPDIELMVSVCAGLVTIDDDSKIIRLVHYTTQEYFQQRFEKWLPEPQSKITTACVTYISYEVFKLRADDDDDVIGALLDSYPFYDYASLYWGDHAREDSVLIDGVMELLKDAATVSSYCKVLMHIGRQARIMTVSEKDQTSGLHLAAWYGLTAAVDILLNNGTHIEIVNWYGRTPLHAAAQNGWETVVQLLLNNGANIEAADNSGNTPLHVAAENDRGAVVQLLLGNSACIEAFNTYGHTTDGHTPLHVAAQNGHAATVQLLLDNNADIEAGSGNFDGTPLCLAAYMGCKAVVQLLLDRRANIEATDHSGCTPLHAGARSGDKSVVQILLENNANIEAVDELGNTPLLEAVSGHSEAGVQLLLHRGANIKATDWEGHTALHMACLFGDHIPGYWFTPLFEESKDRIILETLLNFGADIEAPNIQGYTPLHIAVAEGDWEAARLLVRKGANVNTTDEYGKTPLFSALEGDHIEKCDCMEYFIQLLLNHGADTEATDDEGRTALYVAAQKGYKSAMELILGKGAARVSDIEMEDLDNRMRKRVSLN